MRVPGSRASRTQVWRAMTGVSHGMGGGPGRWEGGQGVQGGRGDVDSPQPYGVGAEFGEGIAAANAENPTNPCLIWGYSKTRSTTAAVSAVPALKYICSSEKNCVANPTNPNGCIGTDTNRSG